MSAEATGDHDVRGVVEELGIRTVRHFTTNRGLLGTLTLRRLLSRRDLQRDEVVDLIAINNCFERWDRVYFGYVNLSLQRINGYLYNISSGKWHDGEDLWWVVLDFDPVILTHPGVVFVTTNNGYRSARRAEGASGLRALWAPRVVGRWGEVLDRSARSPDQPTDPQAEALYPDFVSTEYLRTIYVGESHLVDSVAGYLAATGHPRVPVVLDPGAFACTGQPRFSRRGRQSATCRYSTVACGRRGRMRWVRSLS